MDLCLAIILYYLVFIAFSMLPAERIFDVSPEDVYLTYLYQASVDNAMLCFISLLSLKYQSSVRFFSAYAAIVASSAFLNVAMLFDQITNLGMVAELHEMRQELSIPLDVLFAVLGSRAGGQLYTVINRGLHTTRRSDYNELNRSIRNEKAQS